MKKSGRILFILALLFAVIGAGTLYLYLTTLDQPTIVSKEEMEVVVAKEDIKGRTLVTIDMLEKKSVPAESIFGEYIQTPDEVVGKYLKSDLYAGSMIHKKDILEVGMEDLAMKLDGIERAVTVSVDGKVGVSKLIKVGDRVDVLVYLPQLIEQNRIVRPDIVKMFLQNLEVLAIDQNIEYESKTVVDSVDKGNTAISTYFVTLAVPVTQVESFVLAKDIGLVDLALRPHEGDKMVVTNGVIWQDLLLNDFGNIKDLFPQYEIIGQSEKTLNEGDYKYDQYVYYTVQYGDTLMKISRKFYNDPEYVDLIKAVNQITDEDLIISGTGLKIPLLEGRGDTGETN